MLQAKTPSLDKKLSGNLIVRNFKRQKYLQHSMKPKVAPKPLVHFTKQTLPHHLIDFCFFSSVYL